MLKNDLHKLLSLGLSPTEFAVMRTIENQTAVRQVIAVNAFENEFGTPCAAPHCEDYLRAVDDCERKHRWLHCVEPDTERMERKRKEIEMIPACDDNTVPISGDLDFTPEGYRLYRTARTAIFGEVVVGQRYNPDTLKLEVYSNTLQGCIDKKNAVLEGSKYEIPYQTIGETETQDAWVKRRLDSVGSPMPVGPWRLNRHEVLPSGFCIAIQYRLEQVSEDHGM